MDLPTRYYTGGQSGRLCWPPQVPEPERKNQSEFAGVMFVSHMTGNAVGGGGTFEVNNLEFHAVLQKDAKAKNGNSEI